MGEKPDFVQKWNFGKDKSNHIISTSFINNDFLGCAPVYGNGVMYGFTKMDKRNIRLMGATDINTYSREFSYRSGSKKYMSAKTMPYSSRRVYNEIGIERQGTNPDYVVLFDDMDETVKNNTYLAASQFGIPVVYIDKKEIEKQQINNLKELNEKYRQTHDSRILKQLINTYETNNAGWLLNRADKDETHTMDINNSRFQEDFSKMWEEIKSSIDQCLSEISNDGQNREGTEELMDIINIVLEERDLYEGCEERKPISKTKLSFDANEILEKANEGLENIGASQYKVDLEQIPSAEQYKLGIKSLMRQALYGKDKVTSEDVKEAEAKIHENKEHQEKGEKDENIDIGE